MRIVFTLFAIFLVLEISRESIGLAILVGSFLFAVLVWLNSGNSGKSDESNARTRYEQADKISRQMKDLIDK